MNDAKGPLFMLSLNKERKIFSRFCSKQKRVIFTNLNVPTESSNHSIDSSIQGFLIITYSLDYSAGKVINQKTTKHYQ